MYELIGCYSIMALAIGYISYYTNDETETNDERMAISIIFGLFWPILLIAIGLFVVDEISA